MKLAMRCALCRKVLALEFEDEHAKMATDALRKAVERHGESCDGVIEPIEDDKSEIEVINLSNPNHPKAPTFEEWLAAGEDPAYYPPDATQSDPEEIKKRNAYLDEHALAGGAKKVEAKPAESGEAEPVPEADPDPAPASTEPPPATEAAEPPK